MHRISAFSSAPRRQFADRRQGHKVARLILQLSLLFLFGQLFLFTDRTVPAEKYPVPVSQTAVCNFVQRSAHKQAGYMIDIGVVGGPCCWLILAIGSLANQLYCAREGAHQNTP